MCCDKKSTLFTVVKYFIFIFFSVNTNITLCNRAAAIENTVSMSNCLELKQIVDNALMHHYLFKKFNSDLSKKTFHSYFTRLNRNGIYFTESDMRQFNTYEEFLGQQLNEPDCKFIENVYNNYKEKKDISVIQPEKEFYSIFLNVFMESLDPDSRVLPFDDDNKQKELENKNKELMNTKSKIIILNKRKIGVLTPASFYVDYKGCLESSSNCKSSSNDITREINNLKAKKVEGIVLDLRNNGGGDFQEVQKVAGFFIDNPIVAQLKQRNAKINVIRSDSEVIYRGPLIILVNKRTAAGAEVLAGATQDYGRGLIVGTSTFGNSTIRSVMEVIGTQKWIILTVGKLFLPSGKSFEKKGIDPDITLHNIPEEEKNGNQEVENNPNNAVSFERIKPAEGFVPLKNLDKVKDSVKIIKKRGLDLDNACETMMRYINLSK